MNQFEIDIQTKDGQVNTFVVHPDEGPPRPVVLFLMDAPGMREELHEMCRRLAASGYFVVAPNLYYRRVREYNVFESQDRDAMFGHMYSLSNQMVLEDCATLLQWAADQQGADAFNVGTLGYCMSGPFALYVAAKLEAVKAGASVHGVSLVTDASDSPHANLTNIGAQLYVACAETDSYAPKEMVDQFEGALSKSDCSGRVEWYPGTHHGFAFPERELFNADAAARHWSRVNDLFRRTLNYSLN